MTAPLSAHAILISDRLTVDRSRYTGIVSAAPFCYRKGSGFVVVFRYGALVLIGLSAEDEKQVVDAFFADTPQAAIIEEERAAFEIIPTRRRVLPPAASSPSRG